MKKKLDENIKNLCDLASGGVLPHALLIETENIEKNGIDHALCIAKSLICKSENIKPCENCIACKKVNLRVHPDIQIISPKPGYKSIRVDDIRSVRSDAYLEPNEAPYKVYIISDGSLMNEQAQNMLLKVLEEPPKKVKFIILCQSRFSVLATIRSRVQIIEIKSENKLNISSKTKEIIESIIAACASGHDCEFVKATSKLINNKNMLGPVLNEIEYILSEFYILKAQGKSLSKYEILKDLSLERAFAMRESVAEVKKLFDKNINNQLLICKLCIELSK